MWRGAAGGPIGRTFHIFASLEGNQQTRGAYIQSPVATFYPGYQNQWFGLVNMDSRWNETQSLYLRLTAAPMPIKSALRKLTRNMPRRDGFWLGRPSEELRKLE